MIVNLDYVPEKFMGRPLLQHQPLEGARSRDSESPYYFTAVIFSRRTSSHRRRWDDIFQILQQRGGYSLKHLSTMRERFLIMSP